MASAVLVSKFPVPGAVEFDFNPESLQVARTSAGRQTSTSAAGGTSPSILKFVPPESLTIQSAVLDGSDTQFKASTLLDWMVPKGGFLGAVIAGAASALVSAVGGPKLNLATKRPQLTFTVGCGFPVRVPADLVHGQVHALRLGGQSDPRHAVERQAREDPEHPRPRPGRTDDDQPDVGWGTGTAQSRRDRRARTSHRSPPATTATRVTGGRWPTTTASMTRCGSGPATTCTCPTQTR